MIQHAAAFQETCLPPARLSDNLRHISRTLNERGFVLRKRLAYMIEAADRRTVRRSHQP